jgi:hypothetical protein
MRRGAALGIALSLHLILLLLVLRPASDERRPAPIRPSNRQALQVRLLSRRPVRPPTPVAVPMLRVTTSIVRIHSARSQRLSLSGKTLPNSLDTPTVETGNHGKVGDGGFNQRLRNAQDSHAIHGVPGSSRPFVAGIHLIDPRKQGIAAVMRKAQRLFGVTNHHCIDVGAWRQLTPQELSERHISLRDVDRMAEEYDCDAPPGLSF